LLQGNSRFARGKPERPHQSPDWWKSLTTQHPFACVLGCVDSRVPPELVFDQGFGDLFTVRSAGETLDEMVIGSIEYGVEHLDIPLVLVLGHSGCGAVDATIGYVRGGEAPRGEIMAVVRAIEGTVRATPDHGDAGKFLAACVAVQCRRMASELLARSAILEHHVKERGVHVQSATYDLRTGTVDVLC